MTLSNQTDLRGLNARYVNWLENFVNKPEEHSALREWRLHFTKPVTIVILLCVSALLTIIAPFTTGEHMLFAPRFIFWLLQCFATYSTGFIIGELSHRTFRKNMPKWLGVAAQGLLIGFAVLVVVIAINALAFQYIPGPSEFALFATNVMAIAIIMTILLQVIGDNLKSSVQTAEHIALLDRLPMDKRGALVAITVEDHYVRIRTTRGEEVILMRLNDAIKETGATQGLKVHRSHWVALEQVTSARREADRAVLAMSHGSEIPVSRANVSAIKEAGLLPR